jgi:imidazole glycerol-phosphate synthase subunit HisH
MITIVDYGVGNIRAFLNAFKLLNIEALAARTATELKQATHVILPGVGAFDQAMERFDASGLRAPVSELALEKRRPLLGVCVGMQMLAHSSEEGQRPGLGWIDGRVRRLTALDRTGDLRLPHMGWNDVRPNPANPLFVELDHDARFYFLHSYYFECAQPADTAAKAEYGKEFTCAVNSANVFGVQFHPEKSHHFGLRLLKNFAAL